MKKKNSKKKIKNKNSLTKIITQSKNKLLIFLISIIITLIIFFSIKEQFNIKNLLNDLEKQTGITIKLNENSNWDFYPKIYFSNYDTTIYHKESSLLITDSKLEIVKSYWPFSPFYFNINSPLININGIEIKNSSINASYKNDIITFDNFEGDLIEGKFKIFGKINLDNKNYFDITGKFKNISLNTILNQLDIAVWERLTVKLSSNNFNINGYAENKNSILKSLSGKVKISGSAYLITSDEERFGAALLSILVEKLPSIAPVSKSVNFVINNYGNVPTSIEGVLDINEGKISSKNIDIKNDYGKSSLIASLDLINKNVDGKIIFFENDEVFLEALLNGDINNPKILIDGEIFGDKNSTPKDIKKIFEEGISTLIDNLLNINE